MSEFEDREENNGMGELPDTVSFARNERYGGEAGGLVPPGTSVPLGRTEQGIPPDVYTEDQVKQQPSVIGSPVLPANITSVYDARPINARDFLATGVIVVSGGGGI